jgi:DNA-binding transcriptional LysR family regulator
VALIRVAFEPLPMARWGTLFHILLLESPDIRLEWMRVPFPRCDRPSLDGADVGLFLAPAGASPELASLDVAGGGLAVVLPAGHPLGRDDELRVADVIGETFLDGAMDPSWKAIWTLDAYRGGPPARTVGDVATTDDALELVAEGRAIALFPQFLTAGLAHPGLIWLPLVDGPHVAMQLVWRAAETRPAVHRLVDIARDLFAAG